VIEYLRKWSFEKLVAKVLISITNDGLRSTEFAENVGLDEFYHVLVIIGLCGKTSTHLET
jgi:hypothetical protein